MVEKIKQEKDELLAYLDKEINRYGGDKMDLAAIGKATDAVKDLAEAEKSCWEAEYYRAVTEAMGESRGYVPDMAADRMGYNPNRDGMGRYSRGRRGYGMGYHEHMDDLRSQMQSAPPEEREKMKRELRQMLDM